MTKTQNRIMLIATVICAIAALPVAWNVITLQDLPDPDPKPGTEDQIAIDLPEAVRRAIAAVEKFAGCAPGTVSVLSFAQRQDPPSEANGELWMGRATLVLIPADGPPVEIAALGGATEETAARQAGEADLLTRLPDQLGPKMPDC